MKKIIFILSFISVWINSNAQVGAPQLINYQAIARDAAGNVITTAIGVKFEILQTAGMTLVYAETQTITPSASGIFTAAIGAGPATAGTFSLINWGLANHYIRVSIDPSGGTSYSLVGTNQLLSVPYALYSEKTKAPLVGLAGNILSINGSTVNLPGGTYTAGAGISISGGTITNTAPDITPTITGVGITNVTQAGNSYTVSTQTPTLIGAGSTTVTGSYPVFTINSSAVGGTAATIPSSITINAPHSVITNTTSNSSTITIVSPTLTGAGSTTVSGSFPNYVITSSATGTMAPATFSVNAPHSIATNTLLNSHTLTIVSPTITGAGIISAGGSFPSYTLSAPIPSITAAGAATVTGSYPSFTVAAPLPGPSNSTITGVGVATVSPLTGNNFTVNVPPTNLTYNPGNGIVSYSPAIGTNTINITQALNLSLGVLTVGPPSNTINLNGISPWSRPTATATALSNINDFVGIGTNSPTEKLQVQTTTNSDISIVSPAANNSNLNFGNPGNHFLGQISYNNSTSNMSINSNGFNNRLFMEFSGRVGIGTNAPVSDLDVNGSLRLNGSKLFFGPVGGVNSGYTGIYENASDIRFAVFKAGGGVSPFAPAGNSLDVMTIKNTTGFVGIGTLTPSTVLHVNGPVTITDGSEADGKVLVSNPTGKATWKKGSSYAYFYPTATSVANLNSAVMMPGLSFPYTKLEAGTTLEIDFIGHMSANGIPGGAGVVAEIRVDGVNGTSFSGRATYWATDAPNYTNLVMRGIFENLAVGPHTVEIWVFTSAGTTTSVFVNPGNWTDQIIVKETH